MPDLSGNANHSASTLAAVTENATALIANAAHPKLAALAMSAGPHCAATANPVATKIGHPTACKADSSAVIRRGEIPRSHLATAKLGAAKAKNVSDERDGGVYFSICSPIPAPSMSADSISSTMAPTPDVAIPANTASMASAPPCD